MMKKGTVSFTGDNPMQLGIEEQEDLSDLTAEQQSTVDVLGRAVHEYQRAAKKLLDGKYAHLKNLMPNHIANPGNVLVACTSGGAVVRFDKKDKTTQVVCAWMSEDLSECASLLSQYVIRCHPDREFKSAVEESGIEINLFTMVESTNQATGLFSARIGFDTVVESPDHVDPPPHKPFCLASIRNTLEIALEGELVSSSGARGNRQPFVTRTMMRLPVGWECIEIYPFIDLEQWKPEFAPIWAENDILAAALAEQHRDAYFQSLDPQAGARKHFALLLEEFKSLLDSEPEREEVLQCFLRDNPVMLCPTQKQMWPKLAMGGNVTDFVFRDATGAYLLVELEKSTHRLFRKDGHASAKLNEARGQIIDWKRYLEDNLATVQRELGLDGISTNPKGLVVIGRSNSVTDENRRKLVAIENDHPTLKIMTYDDVYDNAKAIIENLLGTIWDVVGNTEVYYHAGE